MYTQRDPFFSSWGRLIFMASLSLNLLCTPAVWADDPSPQPSVEETHTKEVEIITDEGTWMSVDVSPDGQWVAFDLLGDLYRVPMIGGEAEPLLEGLAWEMQPTYSPDGRWIAFTSDRGGGDNLWVMPAEGGDPWPVSTEDYRLLNSPAWSPDGQYIVGRKHFTSKRSLGSGEMWLYPWRGGSNGVQMTEKKTEQKDEGEPCFSPDGLTLYYSQDLSAGESFEYNKDSNKGIYGIQAVTLTSNQREVLTAGPGGAARPTPSPDGKHLAFIRRVKGETTLWIRDLEEGTERQLTDGLSRDMQETWAVHGVYPRMSWTPDSERLVFWAQGKLSWIEVASSKKGEIPFRVKAKRRVTTPLRVPVKVAPSQFQARMLRWVRMFKDRVIFQALGKLYLLDEEGLEASTPSSKNSLRSPLVLHTADHKFAYYPSLSADGTRVIYIQWSDIDLGQVMSLDLETGEREELSVSSGHYINPLLSPDEQWLIYQRVSGGWITSPRRSHRRGLYALYLETGEEFLIDKRGGEAHFGPEDDRIYFTVRDGEKKSLYSQAIPHGHRWKRAESDSVQGMKVSPDGKWLAFQADFNVYVTLAPSSARPLKLGPKERGLPILQVSTSSGFDLQWAPDSASLYWSLGATVYRHKLPQEWITEPPKIRSKSLTQLPSKEGSSPPASDSDSDIQANSPKSVTRSEEAEVIEIQLSVDTAYPRGRLALIGPRVITMQREEVIEEGFILIEEERITQVGLLSEWRDRIPKDAYKLNLKGHTVFPGLIDVHAHGAHAAHGIIPHSNWLHAATLTFGVTTLHDPSNHSQSVFAASEMLRAGVLVGPRLFSTGTILYGAKGGSRVEINSQDDALRHLERHQRMGAFSVKSYNQPRRDQRQQIIAAGRALKMMVVPEGGSLFHHNMTQVIDGHTTIEHALPVAALYEDVLQLWSATPVGYTPTFNVAYGGLMGENYWYQESEVYRHPRLTRFTPTPQLQARARRPFTAPPNEWNHIDVARAARKLMERGVRINAGGHGQREGLGLHWEMWSMVQGGFSAHQALRAATLHGAESLGLDQELGRIAPGYLADLAIVKGNPLTNIRQSEHVEWVVLNGALFQASTMAQFAPTMSAPPHLFFAEEGVGEDRETRAQGECGCSP